MIRLWVPRCRLERRKSPKPCRTTTESTTEGRAGRQKGNAPVASSSTPPSSRADTAGATQLKQPPKAADAAFSNRENMVANFSGPPAGWGGDRPRGVAERPLAVRGLPDLGRSLYHSPLAGPTTTRSAAAAARRTHTRIAERGARAHARTRAAGEERGGRVLRCALLAAPTASARCPDGRSLRFLAQSTRMGASAPSFRVNSWGQSTRSCWCLC